MLEIRKTTVYRGPNVWARMPAIVLEVDIGDAEALRWHLRVGLHRQAVLRFNPR